jgi:TldD protein
VKVAFDPRAARAGYARLGRAHSSLIAEDSDRLGISAATEAVEYAGASELAATRVAVLLEQGAAIGLVHEVFGHLLEAGIRPAYLNGRGRLCRVPLRVVDDPGLALRFGSYQVDDEGVRRSRTVLVEHGMVQDTLASRASVGRSSTGNGRRESWRHRALTRMSNVVVSCPGGDDATVREAFDDLGSHTKTLRLVTLRGGSVSLSNGRFRLHTGTTTLHGREPQWVRDVTIEGSAVDVLGKLVAVGRTPTIEQSLCGKGGQRIPVSGQAPAMLVRDMHAWSGAPLPKSHRGGPEGAP